MGVRGAGGLVLDSRGQAGKTYTGGLRVFARLALMLVHLRTGQRNTHNEMFRWHGGSHEG